MENEFARIGIEGIGVLGIVRVAWHFIKRSETVSDQLVKTIADNTDKFVETTDKFAEATIAFTRVAERIDATLSHQTELIQEVKSLMRLLKIMTNCLFRLLI